MTQIFDTKGLVVPVTLIEAGPCIITAIKDHQKYGYSSIQIGYEEISPKKLTKPILGHFQKNNLVPLKYLYEVRTNDLSRWDLGQVITVNLFTVGQKVKVSGKSIGKGFAGCQKRHHFSRGPMTHGSKNHRQPGSIGAGTTPGRVIPGKKMAGQLGHKMTTIKNLEIIHIEQDNNLLVLKGNIPGKAGNIIKIFSESN